MEKFTTPYTPEQNGFAKRMNTTPMENVRSILNDARLAQDFWEEVVDTIYYLVNRSPISSLVDKTPHQAWFGKKPSLEHIQVFGCDSFVHVPKEKRSKLDSKEKKSIFIDYKDGVKGYKLWNLVTRKTNSIEM